ncbi:MAG: hypothetical protein ABI353_09970 [Isosphaeraceae bacterium]
MMTPLIAVMLLGLPPSNADEGPLNLADLAAYPDALSPPSGQAKPVRFHELWQRPETFRGTLVQVSGQVERRFRAPAVGKLPALVEVWIVTPEGNPFCLVYPDDHQAGPQIGSNVRFNGTYLRQVRYQAGDGDRLAPLIVGGRAPLVPARKSTGFSIGWSRRDWLMAGTLAAVVAVALALKHLRRPLQRRERPGPPPIFEEPDVPTTG